MSGKSSKGVTHLKSAHGKPGSGVVATHPDGLVTSSGNLDDGRWFRMAVSTDNRGAFAVADANKGWWTRRLMHELDRIRNPVKRVRRKLTNSELEAGPGPLNAELVDIAGRRAQPTEPPSSMLLEARRDRTVLIAAERG